MSRDPEDVSRYTSDEQARVHFLIAVCLVIAARERARPSRADGCRRNPVAAPPQGVPLTVVDGGCRHRRDRNRRLGRSGRPRALLARRAQTHRGV